MLPKTAQPLKSAVVPSTGQRVDFRPMKFKEEKILLMAKEGGDPAERGKAVLGVVSACLVDADASEMTNYDIDYLFITIRSASVSPTAPVSVIDRDDGKTYDFDVELDKVTVIKREDSKPKTIDLGNDIAITLRDLPAKAINDPDIYGDDEALALIRWSIKDIWQKDKKYDPDQSSINEVNEFIENLDLKTIGEIRDWIMSSPKLNYVLEYTNSQGNEKKIILSSLSDFFTL